MSRPNFRDSIASPVMAEIAPSARLLIAQAISHAVALEAVASDLEAAGIPATRTRIQAESLRQFAADHRESEQRIADAVSAFHESQDSGSDRAG